MEPENIYYLGFKQSEAEASFYNQTMDGYFAGSVTIYGNNMRGNIAYNASCKAQLSKNIKYDKRNAKAFKEFFNEKCREIVARVPDAYFYPYSHEIGNYAPKELRHRFICSNNYETYNILDSKFKFRDIFNGILPFAPYVYMSGKEVLAKLNTGEYPNKKQAVIQREYGASCFGTIIATKDYFANPDFKLKAIAEIVENETYVVSDYIESIGCASMHMIVSNNEVIVLPSYMHGYKDHHKLSYLGLKEFTQLTQDQQKQAKEAAEKFGKFVQTSEEYKMRGWLHIDVIFATDGKVYVMEANPRFGGGVGLYNRIFRAAGLKSVFQYNYMAFYEKKTNLKEKLENLKPSGLYRHAKVEMIDGELVSSEAKKHNREGFNLTIVREDEIYTHSVYEMQD